MKPDGVDTSPSESMETEGTEPVKEPTSTDEASQNGTTPSPPQPDEPQNEQAAPPTVTEAPVKAEDAKNKPKVQVKGKTTAAGPGARPKATQSRVANGLSKTASSTPTKKPIPATTTTAADKKKPTTNIGHSGVRMKPVGSTTAVATSRAQPKGTTVGTSRLTTTTTAGSGTKTGTAVSTTNSLSRRPATAASSAATKPKTTAPAPRPTTAPAAKPSTSASAKTTAVPKTNRATGSYAPRSATGRTVTGTTTTAATRTSRTVTQQPVKPLVTASAARKDVGKTSTTAPAKRTVASTISCPASNKASNSEAPKPAAATKRPPSSIKAPQPKPDDKKSVPTRKVPPSPRNNPSRLASGKNTAVSPSPRQAGSGVGVKLQQSKPIQSVLPLVKGKLNGKQSAAKPADKEPAAESVQLSAAAIATVAVATSAAIVTEEAVSGPDVTPTVESSLDVPTSTLDVQENVDPNVNSQSVLDISNTEPEVQEALIETSPVEVACPTTSDIDQESKEHVSGEVDEKLISVAPTVPEATEQETLTASPVNNSAAAMVSSSVEVAEKAELINSDCYEDVEEEEREGSQQISLSEMSGTQPTEESRPGSAGVAGSVWRAGALLSELDSEDVSCSQQGASELSAPGVLEGTESMDDLGDASLKGADGEGASVGSPDFEKVPDILANEDDDNDDEDDRICDMEVGSERAEDSHGQHHDNEDDEDVEMASEGITESGLESYGNADEDDLTEDYRLDNLNRIQPPPMVPSAPVAAQWNQSSCFTDAWAQPPQPASTLLSSPSSECWPADPETPTQTPAQASLDVVSERGSSSSLPPNLFEPPTCAPQQFPLTATEGDVSPKSDLIPSQTICNFQSDTSSDPDLASNRNRDTSIPEEVEDYNKFSGTETHSKGKLQPEPLSPVPTVLPEMQDLGIHFEHADEEEEPETLPADDVLGGPATAPSSSSSATEDEASDTEGEMQITETQAELPDSGNPYGTAPVGRNVSSLDEREEMSGENGAGGGSVTPQSAISAASYGFDYMTSNSNVQSSAESCSKSPGIFSLENEEQLPDEAKDPSFLKELTLIPATGSGEKLDQIGSQHEEFQSQAEQQYMLCGESSELPGSVPGARPLNSGLTDPSSPQHLEEEDLDNQHPYYSTICEKTDSPLAERNLCFPPEPNDLLSIQMTMSSKLRVRPRAAYVTQPPRLPTDLPPRVQNAVSNTQLRCLEQHQQHLHEIQQRQEKRNREQEKQEEREEKQARNEREQQDEEERRNLLELKLKQQEQELKQRQQIMQWQQELEQQQQQQKHKVHTPVVLSPLSGLSTIYETVEASDTEDEQEMGQKVVEVEDKSSFNACPGEDMQRCTENNYLADLYSQYSTPSPESTTQDSQRELQETPSNQDSPSPLGFLEQPPPLEFDWGKKVDIVHQLINQTLLLTGDGCSPLFLLPGGTGGTLSPLESSLWPNLLPPLTPPSATVTSVSSFSPEVPGSSAQGEWTVVELETHH